MSATAHHLDRIQSKKLLQWVYWPIPHLTGTLHAQPRIETLSPLAIGSFTPDFEVFFDARGALDAPECVPSGGTKAHDIDLEGHEPLRLMVCGIDREGAFA